MITEYKKAKAPSTVYIPLTDGFYKIANVKVEEDDRVLKGQVIAYKFKGKDKLPVLSPVSGKILEFKEMTDRFGKVVDHCVIENDYKDEHVSLNTYSSPSPSQVIQAIKDAGLEHVNVDGSFTPLSFDQETNHLFVNAIFMDAPFHTVDYNYLSDLKDQIASGIELIAKAARTENITIFTDKRMNKAIVEEFGVACVDKNVNFVSLDSKSINGAELKYILKAIKTPIGSDLLSKGAIYVDVHTAAMVHNAVKEGIMPATRLVALTGNGVNQNALVEVTVGTLIKDVVAEVDGYKEVEELLLHIGNPLTGRQVLTDEVAITVTVDGLDFSVLEEEIEDVCIKCGECNDVCPAGILPQNIMDAELRSVNDRIVELNTHECTECGLCSYVCPSKINVLEWVRRARRRVG